MKFNLPTLFCVSALLLSAFGMQASAQGLKISVVDMQDALNRYYETVIAVG